MRLYRIAPRIYLNNYQGLGASYKDGGRWNASGQPVLNFSLSPATALLEMANYLPSPRLVPKSYRLGIYELDSNTELDSISNEQLPVDWAEFPYPLVTQTMGSDWLIQGRHLGLLIPSAAVPAGVEKNIMINPLHEDINALKLIDTTNNLFNHRTFSGLR